MGGIWVELVVILLGRKWAIQGRYCYQQERNEWGMGGTSSNIIREKMGDTREVLLSIGQADG